MTYIIACIEIFHQQKHFRMFFVNRFFFLKNLKKSSKHWIKETKMLSSVSSKFLFRTHHQWPNYYRRHHTQYVLKRTTLRALSSTAEGGGGNGGGRSVTKQTANVDAKKSNAQQQQQQQIELNPPKGTRDFPPEEMRK